MFRFTYAKKILNINVHNYTSNMPDENIDITNMIISIKLHIIIWSRCSE